MSKKASEGDTVATLLSVVADLVRGDRHSRRTIAVSTGKSLPPHPSSPSRVRESYTGGGGAGGGTLPFPLRFTGA